MILRNLYLKIMLLHNRMESGDNLLVTYFGYIRIILHLLTPNQPLKSYKLI